MPTARTNKNVMGKTIAILIKKPAGTDFIPFGCVVDTDFDLAGAEVEEIACQSGSERAPSGDIKPPTLAFNSLVRAFATADVATNISDEEVADWVAAGTTVELKYVVGGHTGDKAYTGSGFFNSYKRTGPLTGVGTASATFNFLAMPVKSTIS